MQAFWTETAKEFMACNVRKEGFDKPAERYKQWRQALQDKLSADLDLSALVGFARTKTHFNA